MLNAKYSPVGFEYGVTENKYIITIRNKIMTMAFMLVCFTIVYFGLSLWSTCYPLDVFGICLSCVMWVACGSHIIVSEIGNPEVLRAETFASLFVASLEASVFIARVIMISQCYNGWDACPCVRGSMIKSWAYTIMDFIAAAIFISQTMKFYSLYRDTKTHPKYRGE